MLYDWKFGLYTSDRRSIGALHHRPAQPDPPPDSVHVRLVPRPDLLLHAVEGTPVHAVLQVALVAVLQHQARLCEGGGGCAWLPWRPTPRRCPRPALRSHRIRLHHTFLISVGHVWSPDLKSEILPPSPSLCVCLPPSLAGSRACPSKT